MGQQAQAIVAGHFTFSGQQVLDDLGDELGDFEEAGACGTAAIISPIREIVDRESGKVYTRMTGADNDDKIEGLLRLTRAVHRHGSKICAQIYMVLIKPLHPL